MGFKNWWEKAGMPLDCYGKRFLITLSKTCPRGGKKNCFLQMLEVACIFLKGIMYTLVGELQLGPIEDNES